MISVHAYTIKHLNVLSFTADSAILLKLCPFCQVEEGSEEEEELTQTEEESDEGDHFGVIPLYSERATISSLESSGTGSAAPPIHGPHVLIVLLLLSASLNCG